jgi:hypothetical protein
VSDKIKIVRIELQQPEGMWDRGLARINITVAFPFQLLPFLWDKAILMRFGYEMIGEALKIGKIPEYSRRDSYEWKI